jgi:hypothetical protein
MTGLTSKAILSVFSAATATAILAVAGAASASTWAMGLQASSHGASHAQAVPSAPTGISAVCAATKGEVTISWTSLAHATNYTVYDTTTSAAGTYSSLTSGIATTSSTTAVLISGKNYWFEVGAYFGTNWAGTRSTASTERQISASGVCS